MSENQTLGGKDGETTQVATPTTTTVPGSTTVTTPPAGGADQTVTTPVDTTTVKPGGVDDQQPAPRSRAAERIGELLRKTKVLQEELDKYRGGDDDGSGTTTTPASTDTTVTAGQQQTVSQDTPEFQRAKDFLKNLGFSPTDDIQKVVKDEISNFEARLVLDTEKARLENKYGGGDGRPKYDHEKVIKHAVSSGIYNPEAAYKDLHEAELLDWAIKQAQQAGTTTTLEKPSSTTTGESGQLDRESLARILSSPEGRKWYEENRDKVLSALQKGEL